MGLQTQVYKYKAASVPGAKATPNQAVYTPFNYFCADDAGIPVGGFAFSSDDADNLATAVGGSELKLLGFVERVIAYPNYDVSSEGTLVVPKGYNLTIAVRGDFYVTAPATVAVGDIVYCDDTGAISADGDISTGWVYRSAGDEGELVVISNWNLA